MPFTEFGKNVEVKADGKKGLVIRFDLKKELGESGSGASILVASANGVLGQSGVRVGLNAWFKKDKKFNEKGLDCFTGYEGENLTFSLSGTVLTIECDLSKEPRDTSGGKSKLFASTKGNRPIGKSNIMVGLNVTAPADKVDKIDITKLGAETEAHNMKLSVDKAKLRITVNISKETTVKSSNGKFLIASSKGSYPCPKPLDDLKIMLNITSRSSKLTIDQQAEPKEVPKGQGTTYTVKGDTLTFYIDTTNDFGPSASGLSTTVGTANGMFGSGSCNLCVYRRDPTKKAAPKEKSATESGKKRKATVQYDKVKEAVKEFMDKTDEDLTVGTIRRAVCKKYGWDADDDKLKSLVKKAIAECEDEDDEEESGSDE